MFKTPQLFQVPKKFWTQAKAHKLVERVRGLGGCGAGIPSVQLSWPCYAMLSWHGQGLAMRKGGLGSITEENEELLLKQWEMIEVRMSHCKYHLAPCRQWMNLSAHVDHLILAESLGKYRRSKAEGHRRWHTTSGDSGRSATSHWGFVASEWPKQLHIDLEVAVNWEAPWDFFRIKLVRSLQYFWEEDEVYDARQFGRQRGLVVWKCLLRHCAFFVFFF